MRAVLFALAMLSSTVVAAERPKNIIMVVGDGMGPAFTTGYRYFANNPDTAEIEHTVFDRLQVGMQSTYPASTSGYVTDSAAGATAFSCGLKTYNGAIAVDANKKPCLTLMEWAKQKGMKTGLAVTSQIVHATPAAFVAHNESRKRYNDIADSFFSNRVNGNFVADVMLGGGTDYFIREDRDLVKEFKQAGYQYVDSLAQLDSLKANTPVLGLFAPVGLPGALDRQGQPGLLAMVKAAVKQLQNDKGYFLLVEASQVDWAGHANDAGWAMAEMQELARVLEWLEANTGNDTLLVVTADHSTGGLTLAAGREYRWEPDILHDLKASPATAAKKLKNKSLTLDQLATFLAVPFSQEELKHVQSRLVFGEQVVHKAINQALDKRTNTGWTTSGHTAVDVPVLAKGPGEGLFIGHLNNTDIGKNLFKLLGKE